MTLSSLQLLGADAELEVLEILRALPERRVALAGRLDGERVFAKLFCETGGGARRARREERRARAAQRRGLRVAEVIGRDRARDEKGGIWAVVLQTWIADARDHRDLAPGREADPKHRALARDLFAAWGDLHACGLDHADPHPGNVLRDARGPIFVDLGAIRPLGFAFGLGGWIRAGSVGTLLAQIDPSWWRHADELLAAYAERAGRGVARARVERAAQAAWRAGREAGRRRRLRACGDVEVVPHAAGRLLLARRSPEAAALRAFIAAPDSETAPPGVSFLRPGSLAGARRGWSDLWILRGYGLPVAAPLALVESAAESILVVAGTEPRARATQARIALVEEARRAGRLRGVEAVWENAPSLEGPEGPCLGAWALAPRFRPPLFGAPPPATR